MKKNLILTIILTLGLQYLNGQNMTSLYSDIKANQIGDALTVIIVESANASRESSSKSASNSDFAAQAGTSGNLADFLPMFGGSSSVGSNYNGSDNTEQKDKLTGRITVRIVENAGTGLFKIKGERKLGVNGEENLMQLEGFVRAKDISTMNTVYSYNIADAKITYRKSGLTNRFLGQGTITKTFTWLIGGLMVAAGAGYFAFN